MRHPTAPNHPSMCFVEQLAIQQQIELLQQQQQQIQATQQQYMNMGMIPPTQQLGPGGAFNPLQPAMPGMNHQNAFQFPQQIPQQNLAPPTQPMAHRRNQSALPNMGMGPPPAPSSGASGSAFGSFENQGAQGRENAGASRGRGGGAGGGGHQRRHSLALADAKKAADIAQQKRTTSGFQFPGPNAAPENGAEGASAPAQPEIAQGSSGAGRGRGGHGRSQSMAVGAAGRGGGAGRGGAPNFTPDAAGQSNDFQRRGSATGGHARTGSRNFEGNWRNQSQTQDQAGAQGGQQGFQPGHRSRGSVNQSISNFQFPQQGQMMQM
ncbi:hypothetical protein BN1723_019113, partial [Verticillium longisporum]